MPIAIISMTDVKTVRKPWGYERWIAHGAPDFRYSLKEIFLTAGHRTSVQFHERKEETHVIMQGRGVLHFSETPIDLERYRAGGYTAGQLGEISQSLKQRPLEPGVVFHVKPGYLHRVESVEDLLIMEASTGELDDVVRLADDAGRPSGRIDSEHTP